MDESLKSLSMKKPFGFLIKKLSKNVSICEGQKNVELWGIYNENNSSILDSLANEYL